MKKLILLAGIAALAMPVSAYATDDSYDGGCRGDYCDGDGGFRSSGSFSEKTKVDIDYENDLDASIDVDVEYDKHLSLYGRAYVHGNINVNSSAVAVSDPKLVVEKNEVDGGWKDWDPKDLASARGGHSTENTTTID